MSPQLLRIIDANTNRIGEGLRLLEEVARLLLSDAPLSQQLKGLRHELTKTAWLPQQLIQARDSEGDVGAGMEVPGEEKQRDLPATIVANARRVQESLRVMEELAKIPGLSLQPEKFSKARFSIYTIEKTLLSRLLRRDKIDRLCGLYVIIDMPSLKGRSYVEVARQAIRGGARTIQLRDKLQGKKALLPIAQSLKELCAQQNVLFIMNDYLDLALAADADGLHLGQDDLPVAVARRLLPIDKVLGISVCTVEQAIAASNDGADYLAAGAVYPTPSKEIEVIGIERLHQIKQAVPLPLVAIGGISKDNVAEVIEAGADSVAVISAVLGADDVAKASRQIAERFRREQTN